MEGNILTEYKVFKKKPSPGNIQILDKNKNVITTLENNFSKAIRNEHAEPGNFLVVNNPNCKIIFSGGYLGEWEKRAKEAALRAKIKHKNLNKDKNKKIKSNADYKQIIYK